MPSSMALETGLLLVGQGDQLVLSIELLVSFVSARHPRLAPCANGRDSCRAMATFPCLAERPAFLSEVDQESMPLLRNIGPRSFDSSLSNPPHCTSMDIVRQEFHDMVAGQLGLDDQPARVHDAIIPASVWSACPIFLKNQLCRHFPQVSWQLPRDK